MTDNAGRTPLHLASAFGSLSIVNLLVQGGANLNLAIPKFKLTPLHLSIKYGMNLAVTEFLLEEGASPMQINRCGFNAREVAVLSGKGSSAIGVIRHISRENYGKTLLHFFDLRPEVPGPLRTVLRSCGNELVEQLLTKMIFWVAHERAESFKIDKTTDTDKIGIDPNGDNDIGIL